MPKIISEKEKRLKEELIMQNAIEMFEESNFSEITMNALAKKCKIAKGTLFLYFKTKETLFAKLLYKEYSQWGIHELEELKKHKTFTKESYIDFIMDQTKYLLKERMRMIRLVSMKRSIINNNISPQTLAEEIEGLNKFVRVLSKTTQRKIDFLNEDKVYNLYMARHVIIIGAYELATSPFNIEKLEEINKTNLAVIKTNDIVLQMTRQYLNLYCQ